MEGLTLDGVVGFASSVGGNAILLLVIVALVRGWLVPRPFVEEIRKDRDEWKQIARGSTQAAVQTTASQVKATGVAEEAAKMLAEILRAQQGQQQGNPP